MSVTHRDFKGNSQVDGIGFCRGADSMGPAAPRPGWGVVRCGPRAGCGHQGLLPLALLFEDF